MVDLRRKVARFVHEAQQAPRKGFTVVTETTVRLLGVLIVGGFIFTLAGGNLTPTIRTLAQLFQFGATYQQVAVESTKALTFAISCSAMINAPADSVDQSAYLEQWNTPFSEQGFGSRIDHSCKEAAPGGKGVVKFGKGVKVKCDAMKNNPGGGSCRVYGFALPQQVPFTGPWELDGGSVPQTIINFLKGHGMPKYVLYYQKLKPSVEGNWLTRTSGWNMMAIAFAGVMGAIPAPAGKIGSRLASGVSKYMFKTGSMIGRVARYGAGSVDELLGATSRATAAKEAAEWAARAMIDYVGSSRPARWARLFARGATYPGRAAYGVAASAKAMGEAFMREAVSKLSVYVGIDSISDDAAQNVLDDFFRQMDEDLAHVTLHQLDESGEYTYRIVRPDGTVRTLDYTQMRTMVAENWEEALQSTDDAGDSVYANIVAAHGGDEAAAQQMIEDMSTITANRLMNGARTVDDLMERLPKSSSYASAMDPANSLRHSLRMSFRASDYASTLMELSGAPRREAAQKIIQKATKSIRGLASRGGGMVDNAANFMKKGAIAAACNSKMVRSQAIQAIMNNMDSAQSDLWESLGRCAAYSGAVDGAIKSLCSAAGVSHVRTAGSYASSGGTAACAAMTLVGHAADFITSTGYMSKPGNVNSLYLARSFMPPLQFRLHPLANFFFIGLDRGGSNPDGRFYMASPMYTDRIAGASGTPHLTVRMKQMTTYVSSAVMAADGGKINSGELANAEDQERYRGPYLLTPSTCDFLPEGFGDAIGAIKEGLRGVFNWLDPTGDDVGADILSGITSAVLPTDAIQNVKLDRDSGSNEPSVPKNWSGTFYKSNMCDGELYYTQYPFVRSVPSQHGVDHGEYQVNAGWPAGRGPGFNNVQYMVGPQAAPNREVAIQKDPDEDWEWVTPPNGWYNQIWFWNGKCKTKDLEAHAGGDITPFQFTIPHTDFTIGTGGDFNIDIDVSYAAWSCATETWKGLKWDTTISRPRVTAGATGTTYFEQHTLLAGLWDSIVDAYDFGNTRKRISYSSLVVGVDGVGNNNDWQTKNGMAVYGWNADLQRNEFITAGLMLGGIAAEVIASVLTGGTYLAVTVVAAAGGASGALGEAAIQWYGHQSSWPNH
ncbi:MAG: hypothetical protein SV186_01295 [Candidatus Nanohaloarchaea archaeon]|nr:hypothetical protein [Candidatus Nanohaloarchaea archaeon]